MNEIINQIKTVFENNSALATVTSGSIIVWIVANIKMIFWSVINMINTLISFEIVNTYEDARSVGYKNKLRQMIFNDIISNSKCLWEKSVNLDLGDEDDEKRWNGRDYIIATNVTTKLLRRNLTYGFSIRILDGSLITCNRTIDNSKNHVVVTTVVRVYFSFKKRFMEHIDKMIEEKMKYLEDMLKNTDTVDVGYGELFSSKKKKRGIDTIFTNNDIHKKLLSDIKNFINNSELYSKLNCPYKFAALLEGVPGSGKSSTILALASELGRNIEYINLSTSTMKDVLNSLNTDTNRVIYVFEDIDALNMSSSTNRDTENDNKAEITSAKIKLDLFSVSLSDLLNITDGLLSSDGAICIFTTNHMEKLDSAFIRKGRMNGIYSFRYMNPETAERMVVHHLGHSVGKMKDGIKPAELQETIMNVLVGREDESAFGKFTV